MKKVNIFSIFFIITFILLSCKKDKVERLSDEEEFNVNESLIIIPEIEKVEGALVFENVEQLMEIMNKFGKMSANQRIDWSTNNNFQSQQVLFDELCYKQVEFENIEYAGLDSEITIEEMQELGYQPKLCSEIYEEANKGHVKIHTEEDGALWFELSLENRSIAHVVNVNGFVIVGDKLYQYKDGIVKYMNYKDASSFNILHHTTSLNESAGVFVSDVSDRAAEYTIGDIFNPTCNCWVWYNNSSSERFRHYVYIRSYYDSFEDQIYSDYQNIEDAQKQLFGIWLHRKVYKPIHYVDGNWSWNRTSGFPAHPWMFSAGLTSAMYVYYDHSNQEVEQLFPFGFSNVVGGIPFVDEVEIYNMHIHGSFWGGVSGYNTNYNY